jgi:Disordered region downstream of MFMR
MLELQLLFLYGPGSGRSSENGMTRTPSQAMLNQPTAGVSVAAGPTTNLNIGMDYWGSHNLTAGTAAVQGKVPVSNDMGPEQWIQVCSLSIFIFL